MFEWPADMREDWLPENSADVWEDGQSESPAAERGDGLSESPANMREDGLFKRLADMLEDGLSESSGAMREDELSKRLAAANLRSCGYRLDRKYSRKGICFMDELFRTRITAEMNMLSVDISDSQTEQFYRYYELLTEWNRVMNLTAITDMEQVIDKHFADSVSLVKAFKEAGDGKNAGRKSVRSVIDVGTGAGFPGIPLKIMFPGIRVTLLDSLNKRVKFLNEVIEALRLKDIAAVHGRAEDMGRNAKYREVYDLCVSRAVANLSVLSEYCIPFVRKGGYFVPYKSGGAEEELRAAETAVRLLGGIVEETVAFSLPGTGAERCLIKIKKKRPTPDKYPRKAGVPGREPLGMEF